MTRRTRFVTRLLVACVAALLLACFVTPVSAALPIVEETFNYPLGNLNGQGGWTAYSGSGINPIQVASPALTYSGYPSSGVGNAAVLKTSGEDLYRPFTQQTSGSVYYSFLVNPTTVAASEGFIQLGKAPFDSNFTYARVYAVSRPKVNNVDYFTFGLATSGGSLYTMSGYDYPVATTHLVVVKYTFNPGVNDDEVSIWYDPEIGEAEPIPAMSLGAGDVTDAPHLGSISLRQGRASRVAGSVSGIRVGTSWADVVMTPVSPVVSAATQVTAAGFTANWGAVSTATGYLLDVATDIGFTSFVPGYSNLPVSGTSRALAGLTSASTYYYRLRAVNGSDVSAYSSTMMAATVPQAPTANAAGSVDGSSFVASWSSSAGATGYRLDVATDYGFTAFVPGYQDLTVPGISQTVSGLASATTYYYRVRAVGPTGTSANSNIITVSTIGAGVYVWAGGATGDWTVSTSWTPERTSPASTDVLQFNGGGSVTATNVPGQTIARLLLSGNTTVSLRAAAGDPVLALQGAAGSDLDVPSGCALNVDGSQPLAISLSSGATGSIGGSMTFSNSAQRLDAADAGTIVFLGGARFTQAAGCTGSPFTTGGTAGAVVFASGATFVSQAGDGPFGLPAPAAKVVFQAGSLCRHEQTGLPDLAGRTYANFELAAPSFDATSTGDGLFTVDDLTVTTGAMHLQLTGVRINGNLSVAALQTLDFDPVAAAAITLGGTAAQSVTSSGTLTFNSLANVTVSNPSASGVTLHSTVTLGGTTTIAAGSRLVAAAALTNGGTMNVNGTFEIGPGGALAGTGPVYADPSTLSYAASSAVGSEWGPGTSGSGVPRDVSIQSGTVALPGSPRHVQHNLSFSGGAMTLTAGGDLTVAGTLDLGSSRITTTADAKVIMPASASLTRSSGYIIGNLQKNVATGAQTRVFEVGDANNRYSPVTVTFGNVATAGDLVARATPGAHPNLSGSELNTDLYVGRYWTFSNLGVAFDSYSATFQFVPADLGYANYNLLLVGKYDGSAWSYPTVGVKTATSTQATGLASFSDFALGQLNRFA